MRRWSGAAALGLALAACGSPAPPDGAAPSPSPPRVVSAETLNGRWLVTALDGSPPTPGEAWATGEEPLSISFAVYEPAIPEGATHLGGYNGCNMYGGPYALSEGRLVTDAVSSTARRCGVDTAVDRQEMRLMGILYSDPEIALAEDGGLLIGPPEAPLIRAERDGPGAPVFADLVGRWRLVEIDGRPAQPDARCSPDVDCPQIVFTRTADDGAEDGGPHVRGFTGCNSFGGPVRLEGGRLSAGPLVQTEIGCAADVVHQEARLLSALSAPAPVVVEDGSLRIGPVEEPLLRAVKGVVP